MRRAARGALAVCFACCLLFCTPLRAEMTYTYSGMGDPGKRDDFISEVLIAALDRTSPAYGSYRLRKIAEMPRNRQIRDLEAGTGEITFAILGTANNIGDHLRPILIPVDKGMVGYRILLIREAMQASFAQVKTPDDLRGYRLGQNFSWDDVDILKANALTVTTGDDFEGLYQMLANRRFDAFPRGVSEIVPELRLRASRYPGLWVERSLLLYYPLPIYFWFSQDAKGEALAKRLEEGMWSMINDGSYDTLMWRHNRPALQELDMAHRRVLMLNNPLLPPQTPLNDPRLWVSPAQLGLVSASR